MEAYEYRHIPTLFNTLKKLPRALSIEPFDTQFDLHLFFVNINCDWLK